MIADRNLCLGDLIGVIRTFFHKIGITQVWFVCVVLCCFLRNGTGGLSTGGIIGGTEREHARPKVSVPSGKPYL